MPRYRPPTIKQQIADAGGLDAFWDARKAEHNGYGSADIRKMFGFGMKDAEISRKVGQNRWRVKVYREMLKEER